MSDWQDELLRRARVARLATVDDQGQPHVLPIVFAYDGSRLFTPLDGKPKQVPATQLQRVRNLVTNDRAAVVVDHYDEDWVQLAWVQLRGQAALLVEGEEYAHGLGRGGYPMANPPTKPVLQLRVALTSRDYERLLSFYCAGLGLEPAQDWTQEGGRGLMLELGEGTLELFDEAYAGYIDGLEAGGRVSGQVRLALQVPDLDAALERLVAHGAIVVHPPVRTPWGDYNARVQDPDGLQVTLFQSGDADAPPDAGAA